MKIDIVTPFFYPAVGGAETYAWELSRRLAARNYRINVHTYGKISGKKLSETEVIDKVKVYRYLPVIDIYYYYKFWTPKIKESDLIHVIGYGHMCSTITIMKYQKKFPVIMTTIGVSAPISGPCSAWIRQQFDKFVGISQLKKLRKIIVIAEEEKKWCLKNGIDERKIKYLPVGISDEAFIDYTDDISIKEKFGIEKPFIVYLGRIHPQKGLKELLKAFSRVVNCVPQVKLVLAGPDNNYWNELRKQANELNIARWIKYIGYISEEDKYNLLAASEFIVLPSMYELQGIVLVEAMAQKKPVIATNVGGIPDFVKDGQTGFLISYGDVNSLANKIIHLLTDHAIRKKMGENARIIAERYRWEKIIDEYEKLYQEILNR